MVVLAYQSEHNSKCNSNCAVLRISCKPKTRKSGKADTIMQTNFCLEVGAHLFSRDSMSRITSAASSNASISPGSGGLNSSMRPSTLS